MNDLVRESTDMQASVEAVVQSSCASVNEHLQQMMCIKIQSLMQRFSILSGSTRASIANGLYQNASTHAACISRLSAALNELPWEKIADESGIKCVLMPDEQTSGGKMKASVRPGCRCLLRF